MKVLLFVSLTLFALCSGKTFHCHFHHYAQSNHYISSRQAAHQFLQDQAEQPQGARRLLVGSRLPIRITLDTTNFTAPAAGPNGEPATTTGRLNALIRAMQVTQYFFQTRLKVSIETNPIAVNPVECVGFTPPSVSVSNSDLHIFVRYLTDRGIGYRATGVSCQWIPTSATADTSFRAGRPVMGRIIFNTYNIIDNKGALTNRLFAAITASAIHETTHILGFDQSLYSTYLDPGTGLPYASMLTNTTLHPARTRGNYLLRTPFVRAWARNFFNCSSIAGMPLENQQSPSQSVPGSHWQRLAMYDQLMTGTELGPQKSITGLTFALFKDMGWYEVDDTFNDTTNYGYNLGCDFFNNACYSSTQTYPNYFCNPASFTDVSQCSTTFTGKANCSSQPGLMADGCGLFLEYLPCVDPNSTAEINPSLTLQSLGTSSFCVKGTIATQPLDSNYRSRCYPFECNYTVNSVKFTIGPYNIICFSNEKGIQKTVSGMQGYLQCPNFIDFCPQSRKICPSWCSQNGFCTRGICNCYSDNTVTYSGIDCSHTACVAANNFFDPTTSSCLATCPSGYYANTRSKTCLQCDPSCNECRDEAKICTGCRAIGGVSQYLNSLDNTCVSSCPDGTFLNVDTCSPCDSAGAGCLTCRNSATSCRSCVNPNHYLNSLFQCSATCVGTFYDRINKACVTQCPTDLFNNNNIECIRCPTGFKKIDINDNTCYPSCGPGYYTNNVNNTCVNCDSTCQSCQGPYSYQCLSCSASGTTNNFLHMGMCMIACPDGFYGDSQLNRCQICDVSLHCATCTYPFNATSSTFSVVCSTCQYGYFMQANSTCMAGCEPGFYRNRWNNSCDPCSLQCQACEGPDSASCLTCPGGKYLLTNATGGYCLDSCPTIGYVQITSSACRACHATCETCSSELSSGCVTCKSQLYLQNSRCRYVCSAGTYPDTTTRRCLGCNSRCSYCFGGTVDNCTRCQSGLVLNNFTCADACPTGQAPNNFSVCERPRVGSGEGAGKLAIAVGAVLLLIMAS